MMVPIRCCCMGKWAHRATHIRTGRAWERECAIGWAAVWGSLWMWARRKSFHGESELIVSLERLLWACVSQGVCLAFTALFFSQVNRSLNTQRRVSEWDALKGLKKTRKKRRRLVTRADSSFKIINLDSHTIHQQFVFSCQSSSSSSFLSSTLSHSHTAEFR